MSDISEEEKEESLKLLIEDLQHFGESLWRNEEIGEKRFNFFVTLVTAVIAALVALTKLWISDPAKICDFQDLPGSLRAIIGIATVALFVIGIMTYLRMLQRNHVTDEYKDTLKALRQRYVNLCPLLDPYEVPVVRKSFRSTWLKGGYAETVGVINGFLCGLLLFAWDAGLFLAVAAGALLAALHWVFTVVARKAKQ